MEKMRRRAAQREQSAKIAAGKRAQVLKGLSLKKSWWLAAKG
jgi:hypothetical protein